MAKFFVYQGFKCLVLWLGVNLDCLLEYITRVGEVSGYLIMCQSPRSVVLHLRQDFREVPYFQQCLENDCVQLLAV